jgi:prevent-host-death family protein
MEQSINLTHFLNYLISISDFSKGKTAKVFNDVITNHSEYIVLKNNQPKAVLLSIESYKQMKEEANHYRLLLSAIERYKNGIADEESNLPHTFESINKDLGLTIKELNQLLQKIG